LIVFCASIYAVKELLGDERISIQIYFHLQQKNLEDAISLLEI
jgi:site-specific recombinase XerD